MSAEDTVATNEHQMLADAESYCRLAHPARWEHPANGADRACLTCLDATLAANRSTAATNERETLADEITRHRMSSDVGRDCGCGWSAADWKNLRRQWELHVADAARAHLAATQRPDDREATLRRVLVEQMDDLRTAHERDAWAGEWNSLPTALDRLVAALAAADGSPATTDTEDVLRQHRLDWAGWLESWDGSVGPKPPSIAAVIGWLRADSLPFGVAAADGSAS